MSVFGIKLEKALPYLLGGAFLVLLYKLYRYFFTRDVEGIEKEALSMKLRYSLLSEDKRKEYAKSVMSKIHNVLWSRFLSSFRNNDDVIALVKSNSFCLLDVGREHKKSILYGKNFQIVCVLVWEVLTF